MNDASPAAPIPVGRFIVTCRFDPARTEEMAVLRPRHLAYIEGHRPSIAFGGLIGDASAVPVGICYILDVADLSHARSFADEDPYAPIYRSVDVEPFAQRLPEPGRHGA